MCKPKSRAGSAISAPSGACRQRPSRPTRATSRSFSAFSPTIWAAPPSLRQLAKLTPADVRAFMAARRAEGIGNRSLMRGLAGARSFARFLERNGKGKVAALAAVRAPKVPQDLAEAAGGERGRDA